MKKSKYITGTSLLCHFGMTKVLKQNITLVQQTPKISLLYHFTMTVLQSMMNIFIIIKTHSFSLNVSIFGLLCYLHQSENPFFVNYFHTDIHFRSSMYTYWRSQLYTIFVLYFLPIFFNYFNNLFNFS